MSGLSGPVLADYSAVQQVRLEPATSRSRIQRSTTRQYRANDSPHFESDAGNFDTSSVIEKSIAVQMLRRTRSVAYSVDLVLLNKQQISGGGAYLHCYQKI